LAPGGNENAKESGRPSKQLESFEAWLRSIQGQRLAVVECGAGTAVPTIRAKCEELASARGGTLIRINLSEPQGEEGIVRIPLPAAVALQRIEAVIHASLPPRGRVP
jgi:hypothetical protein